MQYLIISYCFMSGEEYIEYYDTEKKRTENLKKMFEREDIELSSEEFLLVLQDKEYNSGYDSIVLKEIEYSLVTN